MIKNYPKSLMALVCAIGLSIGSCKKDQSIQPDTASLKQSELSSSALAVNSLSASLSSPFTLGINGHPLGDLAYLSIPASAQIDMVKKMGMGIYRIDILSTSDGTCTVPKILQPLLDAALAGKITLLPMLTPRTLNYGDTEELAYEKGKTLGGNFALKYGSVFKYYDMGNDLDVKLILAGKDGRATTDYNQSKLLIAAAYVKGMSDGIHANDPDAQTMISAGWIHWGFLKYCESYGVKFDILAYHWYSEMEEIIARSSSLKISDITVTLNGLFPGKPIWITETNIRADDLTTLEADQNDFLTKFITKCKANPTVKAVLIYELFDEPYKNGIERYYGITKWVLPYTKWLTKQVAQTFENQLVADSSKTGSQVPPVVTAPTTPVVTDLFTNLLGYSSNKPQSSKLIVNAIYYTDRVYQIKSVPSYLANASLIKTANDDKVSKLNNYISFNLTKASTVYVAYDPRAIVIPSWLKGFTKSTDRIGIDDPKLSSMIIYKKDYPAGNVTLGGNLTGLAFGALCQYVLIIK